METYYAVIFTSQRTEQDGDGYGKMADLIDALAQQQPGFIRVESVRNEEGKGRLGVEIVLSMSRFVPFEVEP